MLSSCFRVRSYWCVGVVILIFQYKTNSPTAVIDHRAVAHSVVKKRKRTRAPTRRRIIFKPSHIGSTRGQPHQRRASSNNSHIKIADRAAIQIANNCVKINLKLSGFRVGTTKSNIGRLFKWYFAEFGCLRYTTKRNRHQQRFSLPKRSPNWQFDYAIYTRRGDISRPYWSVIKHCLQCHIEWRLCLRNPAPLPSSWSYL